MAPRSVILRHGDDEHRAKVTGAHEVEIDGREITVEPERGGAMRVGARRAWVAVSGETRWVFLEGRTYEFDVRRSGAHPRGGAHHGSLTAPMPATVRRIAVVPGQRVSRGEILIVLEAMKMELPVRAAADGVVEAVRCAEGELVQPGVTLIELEEG